MLAVAVRRSGNSDCCDNRVEVSSIAVLRDKIRDAKAEGSGCW